MNYKPIAVTVVFILLFSNWVLSQSTFKVISDPVFISPDSLHLIQPQYSPDGKWIAAASAQFHGIVLLNKEGNFIRWLTKFEGAGYQFKWAKDSRKIVTRAFKTENGKRKSAILIIFIDDGRAFFVSEWDKDFGLPGWCNKDQSVYYLHHNELQIKEVFPPSIDEDEQWLRFLFPGPFLQPNDLFVYSSNDRIVIKDLRETYISNFIFPDQPVLNPVLDPTNRWIVFELLGRGMQLAYRDGKPYIHLGDFFSPAWSPCGDWIVCHASVDDGLRVTSSELYVISDGKEKIQITHTEHIQEQNANWSPDGQCIIGDDNLTQRIFLLRVKAV